MHVPAGRAFTDRVNAGHHFVLDQIRFEMVKYKRPIMLRGRRVMGLAQITLV